MYKYEYVTVTIKKGLLKNIFTDYRVIIKKYAQRGFRYTGFIPKTQIGHGMITEIDLVFEKLEVEAGPTGYK